MARCGICGHQRVREINTDLLMHRRRREISKEYEVGREMLANHARHHIPWRNPREKKPVTPAEKLVGLAFELERLQMLAECDPRFDATESIKVITARRSLLELEMRASGMLETHQKQFNLARQPIGPHEVIFENGRARTVPVVVEGEE